MTQEELFATEPPSWDASSAEISACGDYRYALRRRWAPPEIPSVLFVMLNPSKADANKNDQTISKCIAYARRWRAGGITVANLYAYRSTDKLALRDVADPVGPENDEWIARLGPTTSRVICAWGAWPGPDEHRPERVRAVLASRNVVHLACLAVSKNGHPKHPLYLKGDLRPRPWPVR